MSVSPWLIAVAGYVLYVLFQRIPWALPKAILSFFALAIAAVFFAQTAFYQWLLSWAIMPAFGWIGGLFGVSATGIATLLVFIGTAVLVIGILATREVNREVWLATVASALLVTVAVGPVAQATENATRGVENLGDATIATWLGG